MPKASTQYTKRQAAFLSSFFNKIGFYAKATNMEAIKLPAPCNRMLGIMEPLKIFSFKHPNNKAPVPVKIKVNV